VARETFSVIEREAAKRRTMVSRVAWVLLEDAAAQLSPEAA